MVAIPGSVTTGTSRRHLVRGWDVLQGSSLTRVVRLTTQCQMRMSRHIGSSARAASVSVASPLVPQFLLNPGHAAGGRCS
jgi:hypothetical protein